MNLPDAMATPLSAGLYPRTRLAELDGFEQSLPQELPSAADVENAYTTLSGRGVRSPSQFARRVSAEFGRRVWVKYEAFLPIGSFKLRGGIWAVEAAKNRGATAVVTASTGNHGQGVALAGLESGVAVTVFMPAGVDPIKQRKMRDLQADIRLGGPNLSDAESAAKQFAAETGAMYIEDGESPDLMAGAASIGCEILDQVPEVDTIITPVGGGNLAAGICLAMMYAGSDVQIIGVQSSAASGATASWLGGVPVKRECTTLAGGLATERPGNLSLSVLRHRLNAMCLVDEDDLWHGVGSTYERVGHNLELAAVAPFAALARFGEAIQADNVVLVASGACIGSDQLAFALAGRTRDEWEQHVMSRSS